MFSRIRSNQAVRVSFLPYFPLFFTDSITNSCPFFNIYYRKMITILSFSNINVDRWLLNFIESNIFVILVSNYTKLMMYL